jgi:hypothetical protein
MEPSTSLLFENYISSIITNFTDDQNAPIPIVDNSNQEDLVECILQNHRHEMYTELTNFLDTYDEDDDEIERKAIHMNIEGSYDNNLEIKLRDSVEDIIVSDLVMICESIEDRKRGSYFSKPDHSTNTVSWIGIVRGVSKETHHVKILGGSMPEFDDSIHYIYKISNLTTSFRQWKTLQNYTNLNILDAKPQKYDTWKPKKDYKIFNPSDYDRCNASQKRCFDIVGTHFKMTKPTIHMIFGPPGTGKTTTCIGLVLNLLEGDSKSKILYTTTCNSTIEKLMVDIYEQPMFHKHVPIVIGHSSRVGDKIRQYTLGAYVERIATIMKNVSKIILKGKFLQKNNQLSNLLDETFDFAKNFPIQLTTILASKIPTDLIVDRLTENLRTCDLVEVLKCLRIKIKEKDSDHLDKFNKIMNGSKKIRGAKIEQKVVPFKTIMAIALIRMEDIKNTWWNRMDSKVTEDKIKHHSRLFLCTTSVSGSAILRDVKIERVFIEEAAQTILVDSFIPLTKHTKHLVLAGDPKQLQGMVVSYESKKSKYDMSLMHYFERRSPRHQKLLLRTQYRMHPDISAFPNNHFYDGELIDASTVVARPTLVEIGLPTYKIINLVNTKETIHPKVRSYCNRDEVVWIYKLLRLIQEKHPDFDFSRVTIITPYSGQVLLFKEILKDFIDSITVSSIDGIQGKENDVIIASLVRVGDSIGFNDDRHRINVLLTRAKLCMFIVGNMSTFRADPMWERLIKNAKDRRVYDTQKMKT